MNANLINRVGDKTKRKKYSCTSSASPTSFLRAGYTRHNFLSLGILFFKAQIFGAGRF